jgi:hypothetical protein
MISPFAKLNLVRNPFGELTPFERGEVALVDVEHWLELLDQPRSVIQFIGPQGHGKSTHLHALRRFLPESQYVYLPENGPLPKFPKTRPLMVDEVQRLGYVARWRLFHTDGPLILGTHVDFSETLRRTGWNVVTTDVTQHAIGKVHTILNRRIEAARRGPGTIPQVTFAEVLDLQRRHGAFLRGMENELYHHFQQLAWGERAWPNATCRS